MASDRQIQANRRNAQRSKGPQTKEGKAKSSRNALKHGWTAERMLLDDENAEHFEALCDELRSELKPVGLREEMCVDRLAQTQWRSMRVPGYEAAILKWIKQADDHPVMHYKFKRSALLDFVLRSDAFAKLGRHEAHLCTASSRDLGTARHPATRAPGSSSGRSSARCEKPRASHHRSHRPASHATHWRSHRRTCVA